LAEITFDDVTNIAGPFHTGSSWGAAWGDLNGDGRPDLYANNHQMRGSLWRNNGDGTFTDIILTVDRQRVLTGEYLQDAHAGTWGDFDNDGDLDLLAARSSSGGRGQLFVNSGGIFTTEIGIAKGLGSFTAGRMGSWFDYDNDGVLDIAAATANYSQIYRQGSTKFSNTTSAVGISKQCNHNMYAQLMDITDDGRPELLCGAVATYPEKVYDTSSSVFRDLTSVVGQNHLVPDVALADFNNDQQIDIFQLNGRVRPSEVLLVTPGHLEAYLTVSSNSEHKGFTFRADGPITIQAFSFERENTNENVVVYTGAERWSPTTVPFVLDPTDPANWGIDPNRSVPGVYIGYDTATQQWTVRMSPGSADSSDAYFAIEGNALTEPQTIDITRFEYPRQPSLVMYNGFQFVPSDDFGIGEVWCKSVVAGDFDNDMDMDLYMACGGSLTNLPNRLFENLGDGFFSEVASGGGAAGVQGAGLAANVGASDNVVMADYDVDGYLDLFVTNGPLLTPLRVGGPDQLFRNTSSGNHWIQLDLEGTTSNRSAIGAKVYAVVNGVSQVREQNGGYHRSSQDQMRVHFGLGSNTSVDLTVEWPSGQVDYFPGVQADSVHHLIEGGTIERVTLGPVPPLPAPQAGDECGVPAYNKALDQGAFLWKDCTTQQWYFRAGAGGSAATVQVTGRLVSTSAFTAVTPYSLEAGDVIDTSTSGKISFSLSSAGTGDDGFQFGATGTATCLSITSPANVRLLVGGKTLPAALPFNLKTLSSAGCSSVSVSIADVTVDEAAGSAQFTLSLSESSATDITVQYATRDGSAVSGADYAATVAPVTLRFPAGTTSQTVTIPVAEDTLQEGNETFEVTLANATNATIDRGVGVATILDNELSACGAPAYDRATDRGVFLWKDCATGTWYARMSPGGSTLTYQGSLSAGVAFTSVAGVSIEAKDVLDYVSDPARINYTLAVAGTGQDGFDFKVVTDAGVCFRLDAPTTKKLYVGAGRNQVTTPIDLATLGECLPAPVPAVSVSNGSVTESGGAATLVVNLSVATWIPVTVDYTTADGNATSGSDYTPVSGTLSFAPGETSKTISLPIVNDAVTETEESFGLSLSNAVNAIIETSSATVTIQDDDTVITLFSENFENTSGWVVNPNRTDRATSGQWQIGDPAATNSNGVSLQPANAHGGVKALVTGTAAGSSSGSYDVDGGVTSIRSPSIVLPATGTLTLNLSYFFAHLNNASSYDYLRITLKGASGSRVLLQQLGSAANRAGNWTSFTANISDFAGQTITLLIEAADNSTASLIEAGLDDISITRH
jgi:hypothetical protein